MIFKNQSVVSRIESMSLEEEEDDEEHPSDMTSASLGSMEVGSKPWQEHSKLIIVSRNEDTLAGIETIYDYEVLMVQRAAESTNPDAVDFPGGTIKWQDCSERWIALYERLGVPSAKLGANAETTNSSDLIYSMNSNNEALVRQTSLRIAAIRETFEDVGILLVKTRNQFETAVSNPLYATAVTTGFDRKHWQRKVRADPWAFIELCEMLEVAPDIFSVYNWANWLMPPISIVGETRVDEAFFMACLQGRPATKLDPRRVAKAEWMTPGLVLEVPSKDDGMWLPHPQQYELMRLRYLPQFGTLAQFSKWRTTAGFTMNYPVTFVAADKLIYVYPGDDLYPAKPDYYNESPDRDKYAETTAEALRATAKRLHRSEVGRDDIMEVFVNIAPSNKQICPQGTNFIPLQN